MAKDGVREERAANRGRAADELFRTFSEMIARGELKEGDTLPPEREIVETYGVSRTVAREAVQALANRGLVEARPRFRPVVRRPSFESAIDSMGSVVSQLMGEPDGVRNLFETRILTEAGLAREAARHATPADISKLARALQANREAIHDSVQFYETDRRFHGLLFEMTGNPVLIATHRAFVEWLAPQWVQMQKLRDRNATNYEAHVEIFDAIQKGDPDAAEAALRRHLAEAWEQVRGTFK